MKLRDFFELVEKARAEATPEALERDMDLYVSNPDILHDMQSGEFGVTPRLIDCFLSGNTLHVMGG